VATQIPFNTTSLLRHAFAAASLLAGLSAPLQVRAEDVLPSCDMGEIATLPIRFVDGAAAVDSTINGHSTLAFVNTGISVTRLNKPTLDEMGIAVRSASTNYPGVEIQTVNIDQVTIGPKSLKGWFTTTDIQLPVQVGVELGANFLLKSDVEISFQDKYIKLFAPKGCAKASLAYWDSAAFQVAYTTAQYKNDLRPWFRVRINGHEVEALLASEARYSYLDRATAERMGITSSSPGAAPAGTARSWHNKAVEVSTVPVNEVVIGNHTLHNVTLRLKDLGLTGEALILGADFLREHRILVSTSQHKIYMSYLGGRGFSDSNQPVAPPQR
jgi:predicted aspartyl protease